MQHRCDWLLLLWKASCRKLHLLKEACIDEVCKYSEFLHKFTSSFLASCRSLVISAIICLKSTIRGRGRQLRCVSRSSVCCVFLCFVQYRRLPCITSWNLTAPHYFSLQMAEYLSCRLLIPAHSWLEIPLLSVLHRWGAVWLHHSEGSSVRGGDQGVFSTDCVCDGLRAQPGLCTQRPETSKNDDEMCRRSDWWV